MTCKYVLAIFSLNGKATTLSVVAFSLGALVKSAGTARNH
jgi:hypothetical protein